MTINNSLAEDMNLFADSSDKTVKKEWIKPQMKTLLISSAPTIWDSELSTVAPVPS